MDMQSKIGATLLRNLVNIREEKGELNIHDVGAIFQNLASTVSTDNSAADSFVREEMQKLANYIHSAREEIVNINPDEKNHSKSISDASQHLDAVIKTTEEASHTIMDAADEIQGFVSGSGIEKEQEANDAIMRIYEACNFQDLNGQRVTKVINLLSHLEERVLKLAELFQCIEEVEKANETNTEDAEKNLDNVKEKDLLQGPQLPADAVSQDDIDALFGDVDEAVSQDDIDNLFGDAKEA